MSRIALLTGALSALLAVALGAFGAHYLKTRLSEADLAVFETAVRYQIYHSFFLLIVGILGLQLQGRDRFLKAAYFFGLAGILLFCGSLYLLLGTGVRGLGAVTPFGGLCFILGWLLLALQAWQMPPASSKS